MRTYPPGGRLARGEKHIAFGRMIARAEPSHRGAGCCATPVPRVRVVHWAQASLRQPSLLSCQSIRVAFIGTLLSREIILSSREICWQYERIAGRPQGLLGVGCCRWARHAPGVCRDIRRSCHGACCFCSPSRLCSTKEAPLKHAYAVVSSCDRIMPARYTRNRNAGYPGIKAARLRKGGALMSDQERRKHLAHFLYAQRERSFPAKVGPLAGSRRRTPGWHREELVLLAGMGVTWGTRMTQVLERLARVLYLDAQKRTHRFLLALGAVPADLYLLTEGINPSLHYLLDTQDICLASAIGPGRDMLPWNLAARRVCGPIHRYWHCSSIGTQTYQDPWRSFVPAANATLENARFLPWG